VDPTVGDIELATWASAHRRLTGPLRLVHDRPWATVWTAPTDDGDIWLKACAPVQAFEPRLTATLAGRRPELLPEVIAADPDRGLLLLADAGVPIGFDVGPEPWLEILRGYATLQLGEIVWAEEHLANGVPDRRLDAFPALFEAMLARELPLSAGERSRLVAFAPAFGRLVDELAHAGPGPTVQHDDLHGTNVYPRDGCGRILDWGDSCVSHPFLTLFVTLAHIPDLERAPDATTWTARLVDAYLEPWGHSPDVSEAAGIAQRLGPFAHLFKELRVADAVPASMPQLVPDLRWILERSLASVH
jgi:hypothetical protein